MNNSELEKVISNFIASRVDLSGEQNTYHGFVANKPSETSTRAVPDGINSVLLQGKIVYKDEQANVCESIPIAVKMMPELTYLGEYLSFAFANEINFYTKIVPKFGTFDHSVYSLFPKFHHAEMMFNEMRTKSAIIFEDLTARGYKLADKRTFLDYDHLMLMMRKLGQFHAYSYKAKTTSPEWFLPMAKSFQETEFFLSRRHNQLQNAVQRGINALDPDSKYFSCAKLFMKNYAKICKRVMVEDLENTISVLTHGDYLRSNVMFRYTEDNIPEDLLMVDMASCRYSSPVIDLAKALYMHTDQATRDKYWDELIDEYYAALKGTFPEIQVPSKNRMLDEFVGKCFHAYLVTAYFLPSQLALDNNIPYPEDIDPDISERYRRRELCEISEEIMIKLRSVAGGEQATQAMKNILQDMVDRGFLCEQFKFD